MILQTERLQLREMGASDLGALSRILQDDETMRAYEGAFNDEAVRDWLQRTLASYDEHGFGLWAVERRDSDGMIGQCGLTWQQIDGERVLEIGYLFERKFWHQGFASEAARACRDYAFTALGAQRVYSQVRDTNIASMNVAIRNGMTVRSRFVKHYRGVDMPHLAFAIDRAGPSAARAAHDPRDSPTDAAASRAADSTPAT